MTATLVLGPPPAELAALIETRRQWGADSHDEVWEGTYVMAPHAHSRHGWVESALHEVLRPIASTRGLFVLSEFNLGDGPDSYRVPDLGVFRARPDGLYLPTAAMAVEVLSPDDQSFIKFGYYGAHGVDEILIVDPDTQTVRCWYRPDNYIETTYSAVLGGITTVGLTEAINWP